MEESIDGKMCLVNIGENERQRRLKAGAFSLASGFASALWLVLKRSKRRNRLGLLPQFVTGFIGLFQYTDRTCVNLARRGTMNMDNGEVSITDEEIRQKLNEQARLVLAKSMGAGIALTLFFLLLPGPKAKSARKKRK